MKRLFYLLYGFILVTCITHSLTMDNPSHTSNPDQLSVRDAHNHGNNDYVNIGYDFSDLENLPEYLWNEFTHLDQSEENFSQEFISFIQDEIQAYEEQQAPQPEQSCPCLFKACTVTAKSQPEIEAHMLSHFKIKCQGCNITSNASLIHKHFQEQRHEKKYPIPLTYKNWYNHVNLLVDKGLHFLLASVDSDKLRDSAHSFVNSLKDNLSAEDHALLSTVIPTFDGKIINTESLHNNPAISSLVVYEEAEECTYQQRPDHSVQSHDSDNNTNEEDESTTKTLFVDKYKEQGIFLCPWKDCAIKQIHKNCSIHLLTHIKIKCFVCDRLFCFRRLKLHLLRKHSNSDFNQKTVKLRDVLTKKESKLTSIFLLANLMFDHLKPYVQDALIKNDSFINKPVLLDTFTSLFTIALAKKRPYVLLSLKDPATVPTLGSQSPEAGSSLPHAAGEAEDESTTKTLLIDQYIKKELFLCPWKGCSIKKNYKNCFQHLKTHVKIRCFACDKLLYFRDLKSHLLQAHNNPDFTPKTLKLRTIVTKQNSKIIKFFLADLMFDHLKPYVQAKFKTPVLTSENEASLKALKDNFDSTLANNNKYIILIPKGTALPLNKRQRTDQASASQPSPASLPAAQVVIPDQLEETLPVQEQNEPPMPPQQEFSGDETFDWTQLLSLSNQGFNPTNQEFNPNFSIGK